jgi:wobble nucleotide-excising tRNase
VSIIKNLRLLKGATVLADRTAGTESCDFKRFNLVYGFNGSGKTTLSRLFATLQKGKKHEGLPEGCIFEIEMEDGTVYEGPDQLAGIEQRVCVFNPDFIEENLQWSAGRVNPVFYIGREQAELATELKRLEESLPLARQKSTSEDSTASANKSAFALYKRERARAISDRLRLTGRKYEAPNLVTDYKSLDLGAVAVVSEEELDNLTAVSARSAPLPKVGVIEMDCGSTETTLDDAEQLMAVTIGGVAIAELDKHPGMVPWVKLGHDYHTAQLLDACLYCAGAIPEARKQELTAAFNEQFRGFIDKIDLVSKNTQTAHEMLGAASMGIPEKSRLSPNLQTAYLEARNSLRESIEAIEAIVRLGMESVLAKRATPTAIVDNKLPSIEERKKAFALLRTRCEAINTIIDTHNTYVDDFIRHQEDARMEIRRHFLSDGAKTYAASQREASDSEAAAETAKTELQKLLGHIEELKTKVREHGPAAALINKLVSSYLGHGELTISPIADGYELHRHGKRVRGSPSEGEKTAIALCYFLATLESDGRKIKDLIVVVDDPVSSLDTKAMNYACALIRNRLKNASQLFVLTHNQHCMNEFKKAWKQLAEPKKPGIAPTARLLYLDVTVPVGTGLRSSAIVEMSRLHREYDSEYQFLFQKVLQFEASGATHSDYTFMMPNVIRRVLDVFMAFRIPRNGPVLDKIHTLCSQYGLDTERMIALERLAQVESHSDSLDDLISHSSMTIEEAQDANAALLTLMEAVDPEHLAGLRKYCKAD